MLKLSTRKYKETGGNLRHTLGYYAMMIATQTGMKLNWRELQAEYLNMYGNEFFEDLNERVDKNEKTKFVPNEQHSRRKSQALHR